MKKKLAAILLTALMLFTIWASPVAASSTGRCITGECGQVTNWGPGRLTVKTTQSQVSLAANTRTSGSYDWDAVWVPVGKCVWRHGPLSATKICAGPKVGLGMWTSVPNGGMTIFSTSWS